MEQWRPIENYDNYEISNYGHVKNIKTNTLLKPNINTSGYLDVSLYKNNVRTNPFEILEDFQDRDHESEDDSYEQATTTATSLKSRLQSMQKATAPAAELPMPAARVPAKRR